MAPGMPQGIRTLARKGGRDNNMALDGCMRHRPSLANKGQEDFVFASPMGVSERTELETMSGR